MARSAKGDRTPKGGKKAPKSVYSVGHLRETANPGLSMKLGHLRDEMRA